ncbi:MAG TPA: class I SAM-dependent methyltransferase, partial [Thermoguttaceae bacterium]|nr:class I SAM-dependent methyltransferase [Thermoguttaceae bacterium]
MAREVFEHWVDVYELMVDWPRRLEREGPMFRRLFEQTGVRRVLDTACGPGHHAAMFHQWGLEVEGADLSQAMIQRAIALHGQPPGLRWTVRPFQDPTPEPGYFDATVCIGNSLALAGDHQTAAEAVRQMFRAVRPGGLVVIQVLNLWALPEGKLCWQKCLAAQIGGKPKLILKAVHRAGQQVFVDLLLVDLADAEQAVQRAGPSPGQYESGRSAPPGQEDRAPGTETARSNPASPVSLPWQAQSEVLLGFSVEQLQ